MLVNMKEMLTKARAEHYGIVAPNVHNEDTARAAIEVAASNRAPIILDVGFTETPDIELLARIIRKLAEDVDVPVALNLDHSSTFEQAVIAIRAGFSSIMVDRSTLPFEENIREVSELVKVAKAVGASVEAELGHVGIGEQYNNDRDVALTDPSQAKEYVQRTGIDCLAVAIGTAHGLYKGNPYLDFDRLSQIYNQVDIPLVLHGGSSTGDDNLARACREGISKINIATDLYNAGVREFLIQKEKPFKRGWMYSSLYEGYQKEVLHYMKLFNQIGKA